MKVRMVIKERICNLEEKGEKPTWTRRRRKKERRKSKKEEREKRKRKGGKKEWIVS